METDPHSRPHGRAGMPMALWSLLLAAVTVALLIVLF